MLVITDHDYISNNKTVKDYKDKIMKINGSAGLINYQNNFITGSGQTARFQRKKGSSTAQRLDHGAPLNQHGLIERGVVQQADYPGDGLRIDHPVFKGAFQV